MTIGEKPNGVNTFEWILRTAEQLRQERRKALAIQYTKVYQVKWKEAHELAARALAKARKK